MILKTGRKKIFCSSLVRSEWIETVINIENTEHTEKNYSAPSKWKHTSFLLCLWVGNKKKEAFYLQIFLLFETVGDL